MAFATAHVAGMSALHAGCTPFPQRSSRTNNTTRRSLVVRAEKETLRDEVQGVPGVRVLDNKQVDSYERIEAPVRGERIPDGGPPVSERRSDRDDLYIQLDGAAEKERLGTEVAFPDALRFNGAAPEVINSRLSMLGCIAALSAELTQHTTIFEQFRAAPVPIIGTFVLISVASLIPILKGVPRYGAKRWGGLSAFTPDAELTVGRVAMLGFLGMLINEIVTKTPAV